MIRLTSAFNEAIGANSTLLIVPAGILCGNNILFTFRSPDALYPYQVVWNKDIKAGQGFSLSRVVLKDVTILVLNLYFLFFTYLTAYLTAAATTYHRCFRMCSDTSHALGDVTLGGTARRPWKMYVLVWQPQLCFVSFFPKQMSSWRKVIKVWKLVCSHSSPYCPWRECWYSEETCSISL